MPEEAEAPIAPPEASASSGATFALCVRSLAGELLAALEEARGEWSAADIAERLPPLLPGHRYKLMRGDKVLEASMTVNDLLPRPDEEEDLFVSAVVTKTERAQEEMDLALIQAAKDLDADRVGALLSAGASAAFVHDPPGTWGAQDRKTALHMAISSRVQKDAAAGSWKAVIESLIAAKADVNAMRASSDWRGCGSSASAFEMILPSALQDASLLKTFLDAGANPNTKSVRNVHSMRTDGCSQSYVLHQAVAKGNMEVARTFLDAGAEVDAVASEHFQNERGFNRHMDETSLHIACRRGDVAMAALLLERGAGIDKVRKDLEQEERAPSKEPTTYDPRDPDFEPTVTCVPVEETPLHIAISNKHASLAAFLVCAGADASRVRVRGEAKSSPEELCGDDAKMAHALRAQWSPAVQQLFEGDVLAVVEAVVAGARGKK